MIPTKMCVRNTWARSSVKTARPSQSGDFHRFLRGDLPTTRCARDREGSFKKTFKQGVFTGTCKLVRFDVHNFHQPFAHEAHQIARIPKHPHECAALDAGKYGYLSTRTIVRIEKYRLPNYEAQY
jgi:hypothetical protein